MYRNVQRGVFINTLTLCFDAFLTLIKDHQNEKSNFVKENVPRALETPEVEGVTAQKTEKATRASSGTVTNMSRLVLAIQILIGKTVV